MFKKLKCRYLVAISIIILAAFITPYAIKQAQIFRGYDAVGGEYLIIPLGIILAAMWVEGASERDKSKEGSKSDEPTRASRRNTRTSNI